VGLGEGVGSLAEETVELEGNYVGGLVPESGALPGRA
jgi:hypothetical protein